MLKLPPKHLPCRIVAVRIPQGRVTKLHPVKYNATQFNRVNQMLIIKDIRFGGIWCFSDLVAKNDFLQ